MKKQFLKASFTGGIQILINSLLIFITIPVFIKQFGLELYGVFALLLLIGNLNVFMNLGLNTSLIKFLAEQGKCNQSNYDIAVSFLILLFLLTPITMVGLYFNYSLLKNIFNIGEKFLTTDTLTLFNLLLISNSIILLGQIFSSALDAMQLVHLNNTYMMIYNISYWGMILLSLYISPSFASIGFSIISATLLWFIIVLISFYKHWGKITTKGLKPNFLITAKKIYSYGIKLYTSGFISFFYEPITKLLISHFIGLNAVGFFDIAIKVRNQIWNLIGKLFYPIFPLISQIDDTLLIRKLIHKIERIAAFLIVPIFASVIYLSYPFVNIWIGKDVSIISLTMIPIICGYLIGIIVMPNYQFLMAKGYPEKTVVIQILNVIVNGALFFISLPIFGYYSIIIANVGAILSSFTLTLYYQKKYLDSLIFDSFIQFKKLIVILLTNLFLGFLLSLMIVSDLFKIIIIPFSLVGVSIVTYRMLRIFNIEDIDSFFDFNPRLSSLLQHILIKN